MNVPSSSTQSLSSTYLRHFGAAHRPFVEADDTADAFPESTLLPRIVVAIGIL